MAVKLIKFYPNEILREKSKKLDLKKLDEHKELFKDLIDTMLAVEGIGLAAVQIGVPLQVYAVDPRGEPEYRDRTPFIMINPKIIKQTNLVKNKKPEGCLSIPGASCHVNRYEFVEFEYYDTNGKKHKEEVKGLFANIIQHEIDHGDGKLFIDKLKPQMKQIMLNKFKKTYKKALLNYYQGV